MKPYQKHVFVCVGGNCTARGSSDGYYGLMSQALEQKQVPGDRVKVTGGRCIGGDGGCGFGPNIVIYPEGVWYCQVQPEDIQEIVEEHLLGDRIVSRLLLHKFGETLPDEWVRDLVCGMVFRASEAKARFQYQGEDYSFCAEACLAAFQEAPDEVLAARHGHGGHHNH